MEIVAIQAAAVEDQDELLVRTLSERWLGRGVKISRTQVRVSPLLFLRLYPSEGNRYFGIVWVNQTLNVGEYVQTFSTVGARLLRTPPQPSMGDDESKTYDVLVRDRFGTFVHVLTVVVGTYECD